MSEQDQDPQPTTATTAAAAAAEVEQVKKEVTTQHQPESTTSMANTNMEAAAELEPELEPSLELRRPRRSRVAAMEAMAKTKEQSEPKSSTKKPKPPPPPSQEVILANQQKQQAIHQLNIGRLVEQFKHIPNSGQYYPHHGTILQKLETEGRIPERWLIEWKDPLAQSNKNKNNTKNNPNPIAITTKRDEWTHADLQDHDALVESWQNPFRTYNARRPEKTKLAPGLKNSFEQIRERYHKLVLQDIQNESFQQYNTNNNTNSSSTATAGDLLPTLILLAALEDALQASLNYQRAKELEQQQSEGNETTNTTNTKTKKNNLNVHPPLYYTTNPNQYLVQPSRAADAEEDMALLQASRNPKATLTPSILAQRIRDGCSWAWTYLQQQQQQDTNQVQKLDAPSLQAISSTLLDLQTKKAQEATLFPDSDEISNAQEGGELVAATAAAAAANTEEFAFQQQRRSGRSGLGERTNLFDPAAGRRSTRGGNITYNDNPYIPEPTPVQKGGRVALWWLQTLQEEAKQRAEEQESSDATATEPPPPESPQNVDVEIQSNVASAEPPKTKPPKSEAAAASNLITGDSYDDAMGGKDEDETATKDDDDEDFDTNDEDMDDSDDQLEDVHKERPPTPVPDLQESEDDDDSEDSEEEEEVDEEHAIVWDNPYLTPSVPAILEYLSKPKSISGEDVQKAMDDVILRIRHNKRFTSFGLPIPNLQACDKALLHWEHPDHPSNGSLVLKCVSGETINELQRMDAQTFGRCKFELEVLGQQETTIQIKNRQDFEQRAEDYKIRKQHDKWRFKGVHEGHAIWPQWKSQAKEWMEQNVKPETLVAPNATTTTTAADATTDTEMTSDEALAKKLAEAAQEEASGSRRTARRSRSSRSGGASDGGGGVFYGNQSSMTQKQLMDALIRLVKAQGGGASLCGLQELVADDSSDPLRRIRIALGKILWKQNRLAKLPVSSEESDKNLLAVLGCGKPLLALKATPDSEPATEQSPESTDLLDYLKHLHSTELRLRNLVLKQLGQIPLAVIATAADERQGTQENMDASDFEDPSTIEWNTSGNEWISQLIYRPGLESTLGDESTPCYWYKITSWSESIKSEEVTDDGEEAFERRKRFQAVPHPTGGPALLLTEAQVSAGKHAASLQEQREASSQQQQSSGNPFATEIGDRITLVALDEEGGSDSNAPSEILGRVVGQDTVLDPADGDLEYRILILPDSTDSEDASPIWAVLDVRADTSSFVCQPVGQTQWYSIDNQDFHADSEPYKACQGVLDWLSRQSKAGPFLQPVDPVALGIPSYPDIVKHPMDISTMMEKLENGAYSNILPGKSVGNSLVCRMLNGPFRKDMELIFDNAMLFNPPDDWIHQAAASLKKSATKKIDTLAYNSEKKHNSGGGSQRKSIYADEDSDVDMYEYESDQDEEYTTGRRKRKRSGVPRAASSKDEAAARPMENAIRLQNCLKDGNDLRGRFAGLPLNGYASTYSMPPKWSCKKASSVAAAAEIQSDNEDEEEETPQTNEHVQEMADLLAMQRKFGEAETSSLRRSSRESRPTSSRRSNRDKKKDSSKKTEGLEFYLLDQELGGNDAVASSIPSSRLDVEVLLEKRHEEYYAKLYSAYEALLVSTASEESSFALYSNGAFPPYLGRVVPSKNEHGFMWEIRPPFVVPALRWVLRGLIVSGHLTAIEPMFSSTSTTGVGSYDYTTSGVIISNDMYYYNPETCKPFEVLDTRVLQRKKRAGEAEDSSDEDEVEMSEYEKLRAERVARNAERLKLLGLA